MRVRLLSLLCAGGLVLLAAQPAAAASPRFNPPKSFYLALGDSLAFGFQQFKFNANLPTEDPSVFDTGYVDDFSSLLKTVDPALQTVNFGCPGETTSSYMSACAYQSVFRLHDGYLASQMEAALAFLHAHPGQVSPITIDLGANDVNACHFAVSCISAAIGVVAANMATILRGLRAAAPNAEIIVMNYYNPYAVADASTNTLAEALNAALAADAGLVRGRLADTFSPFNLASSEPATLCVLTLICTPLHDIHASDLGYTTIAEQFWTASGYNRLLD